MDRTVATRWPRGGASAWADGSPRALLLSEAFFEPAVEVSQAWLGLPSGWLIATQQVGDFTQSAAGDVSGGSADFSAAQTVGAFAQSASAAVRVDASAAQAVGAFTQSAAADVTTPPLDITAGQQVGDFAQTASAENDSQRVVEQQATPGYAGAARYRVKVGKRWVVVDPLDALSVRNAMQAAQESAEEVAAERVVDPVKHAARAVSAVPIKAPRVDYSAIAADAKRISAQIRDVYAQALQRELIARLMREQMDREDDDAVRMLLLG